MFWAVKSVKNLFNVCAHSSCAAVFVQISCNSFAGVPLLVPAVVFALSPDVPVKPLKIAKFSICLPNFNLSPYPRKCLQTMY